MKYNSDDVELILKMYRHKIVHLAMPKPIIEHNRKYLSWKLHDENSNNHLKKVISLEIFLFLAIGKIIMMKNLL